MKERITVTKLENSKFWAVWLGEDLLAVIHNKNGDRTVENFLTKIFELDSKERDYHFTDNFL